MFSKQSVAQASFPHWLGPTRFLAVLIMLRNNTAGFCQEKVIYAGNKAVLGGVPCGISAG